MSVDTLDEAKRRVNEARYWLDHGYTNRLMVADLMHRITLKRGHEAADQLLADMRAERDRRAK